MNSLVKFKRSTVANVEHTEQYSDFYTQTKVARFFNAKATQNVGVFGGLLAMVATSAGGLAAFWALSDATALANFLHVSSITEAWTITGAALVSSTIATFGLSQAAPRMNDNRCWTVPALERAARRQMTREDRLLGWRPRGGAAHPKGRDDTYTRFVAYKKACPGNSYAKTDITKQAHYEIGIFVYEYVNRYGGRSRQQKVWIVDSTRDKQLFALGDEDNLKLAFEQLQKQAVDYQEELLQEIADKKEAVMMKQAIKQGKSLASQEQYKQAQQLIKTI